MSPTGDKPWYLCRGKLPLHYISTFHFGLTNEGREVYLSCIKAISGAVAGDSSLQDRGVAHYLLSFHFSLVSLPLSFFTFVSLIKNTKIPVTFLVWSSMLGVGTMRESEVLDFINRMERI